MSESNIEAVEKVLGKPVGGDLPEQALKVRRNLITLGVVSVFIALGEVKFDPTSSVLGFKFIGISESLVQNALLLANVYLLLHFAWYAFESVLEWRLRITGTKLAFRTGVRLGSEYADYPDDPRQSTLYTWWSEHAKRIGNMQSTADDLLAKIKEWEERVVSFRQRGDSLNLANAMNSLTQTRSEITRLKSQIETTEKTLTSLRIPCSLGRFDRWYEWFLRSQNLRWMFIDILSPIGIGGFAVYLLSSR